MIDAIAGGALIEQEVAAVAPVLDKVPGEVTPPDLADVDANAASPEAAPAPDEPNAALSSAEAPEVETEVVASFDPRISIPESLGPVRRAILEGLIDSEGPMSVAELHALMPVGTPRGTTEAAILREYRSGRIIRTSPGHYTLAPARPVEQAKPAPLPEPVGSDGHTDEQWLAWLGDWRATGKWDAPSKHNDRVRKREERRKDAEAATARRAAADAELRTALLTACNGNFSASLQVDDLAPVREVLKVFPLDRVVMVIKQKVDRRCFPGNPPLVSWRDLLQVFAEEFCRVFAIPGLVKEWGAAGRAQATKVPRSTPAGDMAEDIDELRCRHDDPSAPPGPHLMSQPDAAPSAAPDMSQKLASASDASAAVSGARRRGNRTGGPTGAA